MGVNERELESKHTHMEKRGQLFGVTSLPRS